MNIVSEILRNNWLIHSENVGVYNALANGLLVGNFPMIGKEKASVVSILSERENYAGKTIEKNKVAVISMIGEMTKYDTDCQYGACSFRNEILRVMNNPEIKGLILFMDGPGGNADAISVFQEIKPMITKPVVALVDKACSLHYWISSLLAEHIMLNNNFLAECGSIGCMLVFEKPKNEVVIIRPAESKDKNQGVIDALGGDYSLIEEKLSVLAQRFQQEVKANRPQVKEAALFGKTYCSQEAIDMGLADSIGDMNKAYQLVLAKSEIRNI